MFAPLMFFIAGKTLVRRAARDHLRGMQGRSSSPRDAVKDKGVPLTCRRTSQRPDDKQRQKDKPRKRHYPGGQV